MYICVFIVLCIFYFFFYFCIFFYFISLRSYFLTTSISCCKALGSPKLDTSATLLKAFDGHIVQPHGILIALPIDLGGNTISVDVEVVNAPLEYNLLLKCT
jgi:hypothetical protein